MFYLCRCDPSFGVYYEASKLIIMIFEYVYKTADQRQTFIKEMLDWVEEEEEEVSNKEVLKILKEILLKQFTMKLDEPAMTYVKGKKWIVNIHNMNKLIENSIQSTLGAFDKEADVFNPQKTVEVPVSSCFFN